MKKLFSDPRLYADLALCAVVLFVVLVATGTSIPQLGQRAWAAVANITGDGTQQALAQFTGTNTIGNATVAFAGTVTTRGPGGTPVGIPLGTHFACFLTNVSMNPGDGNQCIVTGNAGNPWLLSSYTRSGGSSEFTTCEAFCIN